MRRHLAGSSHRLEVSQYRRPQPCRGMAAINPIWLGGKRRYY